MKRIEAYIESKQAELAAHPFFGRLRRASHLGEILPFAGKLTFWVMAFQDLLQINARKIQGPALAKIARHHMAEDAGHDRWFLADLKAIEGAYPDVSKLFGKEHAAVRHLSYGLMAEVYRQQSDEERIVFLQALESSSHVFFERVVEFFHRHGVRQALKYFGDAHLDAENSHAMFEQELEAELLSMTLPDEQYARCTALIDRSYAAFNAIFDEIEATLGERAREDLDARARTLRAAERKTSRPRSWSSLRAGA